MTDFATPSDDWFAACDRYLAGDLDADKQTAFVQTLAKPGCAAAFADAIQFLDSVAEGERSVVRRPVGEGRSSRVKAAASLAIAACLVVTIGSSLFFGASDDATSEPMVADASISPTAELVWVPRDELDRSDEDWVLTENLDASVDDLSDAAAADDLSFDWVAAAVEFEFEREDLL